MLVRASLRLVSASAVAAFAIALSLAPFTTLARAAESEDAPATTPVIYKWIDENGIAHYTTDRERIPSAIRDRVESRGEVAAKSPEAAAQAVHEDLMRDAVRKKAATGTPTAPIPAPSAGATAASEVPAPNPNAAPVAPAPAPAAAEIAMPTPAPGTATEVERSSVEETAIEQAPVEETAIIEAPTQVAAPAPLSQDVQDEVSAVSAPPPAPIAPVAPEEQAQLDELDQKIDAVQGQIAQREETLAALISTPDEQRTMPLVDDPQFREISQTLPKLQADLQTLRERRNKIQPTAATP